MSLFIKSNIESYQGTETNQRFKGGNVGMLASVSPSPHHSAPLICTLATQSHPGTAGINTLYFAVLSHNPTWQPCNTSDGGTAALRQFGCNRLGICCPLIRSERILSRRPADTEAWRTACARWLFVVHALPQTQSDRRALNESGN